MPEAAAEADHAEPKLLAEWFELLELVLEVAVTVACWCRIGRGLAATAAAKEVVGCKHSRPPVGVLCGSDAAGVAEVSAALCGCSCPAAIIRSRINLPRGVIGVAGMDLASVLASFGGITMPSVSGKRPPSSEQNGGCSPTGPDASPARSMGSRWTGSARRDGTGVRAASVAAPSAASWLSEL